MLESYSGLEKAIMVDIFHAFDTVEGYYSRRQQF